MTSLWVLRAFYVAITYPMKTSALRVRIIQNCKSLIFNPKVSDPSAVSRRSFGDNFFALHILFHTLSGCYYKTL